jgi:hypothetical protein
VTLISRPKPADAPDIYNLRMIRLAAMKKKNLTLMTNVKIHGFLERAKITDGTGKQTILAAGTFVALGRSLTMARQSLRQNSVPMYSTSETASNRAGSWKPCRGQRCPNDQLIAIREPGGAGPPGMGPRIQKIKFFNASPERPQVRHPIHDFP